jgi:predicted transcriptional regulator
MTRREHARILGDVLDSLDHLTARAERLNLAGLAAGSNLPHDRLLAYLGELRDKGLVTEEHLPGLTARGRQFLECYRAWIRIQRLYGIHEEADRGLQLRLFGVTPGMGRP